MLLQIKDQNKFKAKIFKALSDPVRLEILEFLRDGEKCVCKIVPHLDIIQPVVSRHLKILKNCGMVKNRKDGNRRLYSVADPQVFKIVDSLTPEIMNSLTEKILEQII
ncbi:MAG: winged helix-turn-helix transcriptional regulator [Candidatus Bathyarchaeota archaeon]|nr:metalloregulator ArsR/SmtB family transcription factor [Candidatus Bathyarchaeum tardum]WGM89803.1 MAG: metalloregulator ArsR/SmtB family transcription factor [Candidatus Bathyarchaeum tardum]WNZ30099.1 MAG: winged helix-turn-helix transcriptional regulator [Candidatus Bathyarchaeota archaeon]